ncbi:hypothetical protein KBJ94_29545 [Pseudomonas sp. ITA]|uniref:hypothetical protein n=1 Tax=Pseudomonas sp. ITA TaxID=2825841 RepID=UPI0024985019|nr:hypothetical protein [Pseudomonas sp. ITA]MDI2146196.1 hypothetical protein [Pseudomonas sp. ITA]
MQLKRFNAVAFGAVLGVLLLLTGCSPKDYTFSMAKDWRNDKKLQTYVQQLTDPEQALFKAYTERIERGGAAERNASGVISIGEAIQSQTQWESENAQNKTSAPVAESEGQSVHSSLVKEMRSVVTPSVTAFKYSKDKSTENWDLSMSFKNNGSQSIISMKGTLVIRDSQGTELKRSTLQTDTRIEPGAVMSQAWPLDYSSKDAGDLLLKKTNATKLVFSWYPVIYEFADGKKLTIAE